MNFLNKVVAYDRSAKLKEVSRHIGGANTILTELMSQLPEFKSDIDEVNESVFECWRKVLDLLAKVEGKK